MMEVPKGPKPFTPNVLETLYNKSLKSRIPLILVKMAGTHPKPQRRSMLPLLFAAVRERFALSREGEVYLLERFGSHPVQLQQFGLGDLGELLKAYDPGPGEGPKCRLGQSGRKIAILCAGNFVL